MSEYGLEVVGVLALLVALDLLLGTRLIRRPRFYVLLFAICLGTLLFDGYLDARPVVRYGWQHLSGVQVWVVPVEDFGYGVALATAAVLTWEVLGRAGRRRR